ncbi:sterol desaturase family protein [Roseibium marinum]|uniref:Sterol desaturase/sphingolipid hydroxylase (Fatty acid hydroxylase superfamily) n=1 Tax=Roseibium marinum TaxID=281252 RepID=A0A2S3V5D4_9HYPH|nr:sterol desaturase family protein [Roseibium marinum]POF34889.1 sterol desaturase/sphingolipid hydroxylase (fatty acid hydroxylase superfamily) [Roseibium marinum]
MFDEIDINQLRMACFAGIFLLMALLEAGLPRRRRTSGRLKRWPANWGLILLDALVVRLIFPIGGVGLALLVVDKGWGLFPLLGWSGLLAGLLTFLALDLAVWFQHLMSHKIPLFWRIHRVHHADSEVDATTALRFHPIEILLSFIWKGLVIAALGGPVEAVLIFEIVLNGSAIFSHANLRIPLWADRLLRYVIVTPDMHRVHHSVYRRETDSNYGFYLSFWDRLFGTYVDQPEKGHDGMEIGLGPSLTPKAHSFLFSLSIPFFENSRRRSTDRD